MIKLQHIGKGEMFYATKLSAGFDLCSNEDAEIEPGKWRLIGTGLRITETAPAQTVRFGETDARVVPELQIRPRSGLAAKHGVSVLNTPSTIDADYRGEIKVNLINHSNTTFCIKSGDRIAQAVCALVLQVPNIEVKDVERGAGGFGSTGQ